MPEPARVLYCVPTGARGGVERFLEDVIVRHNPDRVKPIVLAFSSGEWPTELAQRQVTVYCLDGARLRHPWKMFRDIGAILKKERIELVHSAYAWCHALCSPAALSQGCKQIWFHHGPISSSRWQGFMPLVPADLVLVNSFFLAEQLKRTLYTAKKTEVVHYGIDASRFAADLEKRENFRMRWMLGEHTLAVGLIGFIDAWKGQDIFLEAAAILRYRIPGLRMLVIGGPRKGLTEGACAELESKLHQIVVERGLQGLVNFTGHVDVRDGALDGIDIFVHASTQPEPFGIVLLEAMAKGKAIIASAAGGPLEILTDGMDGLLSPPGQPEPLADRIHQLSDSPALRERLGANALETVTRRFSAEAATERLENHYASVLQRPNSRAPELARTGA